MANKRGFDKTHSGFDEVFADSLIVDGKATFNGLVKLKGKVNATDEVTVDTLNVTTINGGSGFDFSQGNWTPLPYIINNPPTDAVFVTGPMITNGTFVKIGKLAVMQGNIDNTVLSYVTPGTAEYGITDFPFAPVTRTVSKGYVKNLPGYRDGAINLHFEAGQNNCKLRTDIDEQILLPSTTTQNFTLIKIYFTVSFLVA